MTNPHGTNDLNAADERHRCFICNDPFVAGQLVIGDVNEGLGHRACFGEGRDGYIRDSATGEPLGPDDSIPAGFAYVPEDFQP